VFTSPLRGLIPWLLLRFFRILAGVPLLFTSRPVPDGDALRIDSHEGENWFEVRVEAPGIDPPRDVDLTVSQSQLSIEVRRARKTGTVDGSVSLPDKASPVDITTTYDRGILSVLVPLSGAAYVIEQPVSLPVTY
jgi:HSP20 family protein